MASQINTIDQRLAHELARRKTDKQSKQKEIEMVLKDSEEIKLLKEKINEAYVNKERAA